MLKYIHVSESESETTSLRPQDSSRRVAMHTDEQERNAVLQCTILKAGSRQKTWRSDCDLLITLFRTPVRVSFKSGLPKTGLTRFCFSTRRRWQICFSCVQPGQGARLLFDSELWKSPWALVLFFSEVLCAFETPELQACQRCAGLSRTKCYRLLATSGLPRLIVVVRASRLPRVPSISAWLQSHQKASPPVSCCIAGSLSHLISRPSSIPIFSLWRWWCCCFCWVGRHYCCYCCCCCWRSCFLDAHRPHRPPEQPRPLPGLHLDLAQARPSRHLPQTALTTQAPALQPQHPQRLPLQVSVFPESASPLQVPASSVAGHW